jgi:hypothetical protein
MVGRWHPHFVEHLPYQSKAATVAFAFASAHHDLVRILMIALAGHDRAVIQRNK